MLCSWNFAVLLLFIIKHSARTEANKAHTERLTSAAQLDARPTSDKEVAGSTPAR